MERHAGSGRNVWLPKSTPGRPDAAARTSLAAAIAGIDAVLPGSVVFRHMRCGKAACPCKADPPTLHGPYIQWTRTVAGKTVTKFLTAEQLDRYQTWFDNARRLRELISKPAAALLPAMETAEGWTDKP